MRVFDWLSTTLPVYTTRKDAAGITCTYSLIWWMTYIVILLGWANALIWGVIGLIVAVRFLL
jgi:hypothetical protein